MILHRPDCTVVSIAEQLMLDLSLNIVISRVAINAILKVSKKISIIIFEL